MTNLAPTPAATNTADDDFLDLLGPAWSKMSQAERDAYGPPIPPMPERRVGTLAEVVQLVDLSCDRPSSRSRALAPRK
jgi:hypothetical protein